MPRTKEVRYCARCTKPFHRHNGNTKAKYCSIVCACRDRNTPRHQSRAGKQGSLYNIKLRGVNVQAKTYIKFFGKHKHRAVMGNSVGRELLPSEIVHHIDGNRHNNNIKNLRLLTRREHAMVHLHGKNI